MSVPLSPPRTKWIVSSPSKCVGITGTGTGTAVTGVGIAAGTAGTGAAGIAVTGEALLSPNDLA